MALGADGAIVTTDAGGNSHTDVMLTVRACEEAGVRTTAIVAEMADPDSTSSGLTDWVPEADSIVSAGNAEELVPAWEPERVLGGDTLLDGTSRGGRRADPGAELPRRDQPDGSVRAHGHDMVRAGPLPQPVLRRPRRRGGRRDAADAARGRGRARPRAGRRARGHRDRGDARLRRRLLRRARGGGARLLLELLEAERPDLLVAGPAFGSGRYGFACARFSRAAAERLGIPALAAMHEENPASPWSTGPVPIAATAVNVAGMREALPRMARLAEALVSGRELGPPAEEGYVPRGFRRNRLAEKPGAERAIDLLLAKLGGETSSEVAGGFDRVPPPAPVRDLSPRARRPRHRGRVRPQGNPDRLPTIRAQGWLRYELGDARLSPPGRYESVHGGFDVTLANEDPNRLVPLDTVSALAAEGRVGRVHDVFYTTTGNGTPVAASTRFGREIGAELVDAGVEAVLLSGT